MTDRIPVYSDRSATIPIGHADPEGVRAVVRDAIEARERELVAAVVEAMNWHRRDKSDAGEMRMQAYRAICDVFRRAPREPAPPPEAAEDLGANAAGAWHYQEGADAYTHIVRDTKGGFICQLSQDRSGKAEARARLIARAPEMATALAALQKRVTLAEARVHSAACLADNDSLTLREMRYELAKLKGLGSPAPDALPDLKHASPVFTHDR